MRRRDVLRALGLGALALPTGSLLSACAPDGSDDTSDDTADDTADSDTAVTCTIADADGSSDTHGHSIAIPQADLESPTGDKTYTSTGGTHTHQVTLTAAQRQALVDDCSVTVSSNDSHAHTWTISLDG